MKQRPLIIRKKQKLHSLRHEIKIQKENLKKEEKLPKIKKGQRKI